MRLEPEIWEALREICLRENVDLRELIRNVEGAATLGGRTSAVRVHVLQYFRAAATLEGHVRAGHGTMTATGPASIMNGSEDDSSDFADMPEPRPMPVTIDNRTSLEV